MFRRGKLNFLPTKDDRLKVFTDRINFTEKHLIDLCSSFSTCARKLAKLALSPIAVNLILFQKLIRL